MSCHIQFRRAEFAHAAVTGVLALLTAALVLADLATGTSGIPASELVSAILAGPSGESSEAIILWSLRLPMTLTALFVGGSLALAGLGIQTITANALASPSTLGITSGASFGAALSISAGLTIMGELWAGTIASAFVAALLISALILMLGRMRGMTPATLILAGIIMNFFFMALEQLLIYLASPETAQLINGWTFGNLERAGWLSAAVAGGALAVGLFLLIPVAWHLTTLSIGEERAKSLGVPVERLRLIVFSVSSVLIAAAVSFIGTIAFVGLVAPHCAKLMLGDDQRFLIPGSVLAGGFIMLLSSMLAKALSAGALMPIGIVTSIAGVPFLFILLLRSRRDF
ncbi:iron ABC transporter permease [Sutterella sp.]|uniref:FecCD family ABC transporter permease n=1 Tax=Sutterella sp. TaxID=1981025 RepID=UPI0026DFDE47|nr:iron ABC transporter permease [Sutterella sp.]MDO5530904.1 iron ABC transporter permease [Sutterella sp.]